MPKRFTYKRKHVHIIVFGEGPDLALIKDGLMHVIGTDMHHQEKGHFQEIKLTETTPAVCLGHFDRLNGPKIFHYTRKRLRAAVLKNFASYKVLEGHAKHIVNRATLLILEQASVTIHFFQINNLSTDSMTLTKLFGEPTRTQKVHAVHA